MMKPTVGRIVHYQANGTLGGEYKSEPRAAIVTEVKEFVPVPGDGFPSTRVALAIINPIGMFFSTDVPYSEEPKPGCWSWPPRT